MRLKKVVAPVLLAVLLGTLLVQLPMAIADRASTFEYFDPIIDVHHLLRQLYVLEPDDEAMRLAMIEGMIDILDDPYTQYIPPANLDDFNKQLRGTYAGIGAEVNLKDGYLVIVSPMDDSPALRAGVMAGDTVLEIEGEPTFERTIDWCVERLTGEPGTPVEVRVRHLDGKEATLTIVRDQIVTRTVKGLRRIGEAWNYCIDPEHDLAYVRITQFNADSVRELGAALRDLHGERDLRGLVLDLRDNPGGGLDTAVAMADLFLDSGSIVSVRPRRGDAVTYDAQPDGTLPDCPMCVLVNGNSASASEIVAGALQENHRAKVVGTRTFGKGSVQEVRALPYNGGTLKFTTAHYYLPSGRNLNRNADGDAAWGVDPDPGFVVPVSDEDYIEAFRARREYEIIREADEEAPACVDGAWVREHLLDEQLAVAVDALRTRVATGSWAEVSDEEAGAVAYDQELHRATEHRARLLEQLRLIEERIASMQTSEAVADRKPLLPEDVDLVEGTISIRDRAGNVVGTYRITGGDLELALRSITVEPVTSGDPTTGDPE